MREIKFRAWDKTLGEMFYSDDGRGFQFELSPMGGNGIRDLKGNDLSDRDFSDWQQYIGRTDKNGKEIYEGDIFQIGGELKFTIEWNEVWSSWMFDGLKPFMNQLSTGLWVDNINFGEVIGNIYENPDLVK